MTNPLIGASFLIFTLISVQTAGVRTNDVALHLKALRSTELHPLYADQPVVIWCAFDNKLMSIVSATFIRKSSKERFPGEISADKKNATFTITPPSVKNAGEYECELTDDRKTTLRNNINVFSRPVAHSSDDHFDVDDKLNNHLTSDIRVELGESVILTCPGRGFPIVRTKWSVNGKPLTTSDRVQVIGSSIHISNVTEVDGATYQCSITNEYALNHKKSAHILLIDRNLKIRSPYEFLYPLAVIFFVFLLLAIIIITCEWRKKKALSPK